MYDRRYASGCAVGFDVPALLVPSMAIAEAPDSVNAGTTGVRIVVLVLAVLEVAVSR
jgi:hypothetical protein